MKKLLLVSFCALLFCLTQAYAQSRTITGTVTAKDDGLPLAGVAVRVQGNQTGVATNVDGKFTIAVSGESPVLVFSYIGYTPQSIPVAGKSTFNVVLAPTLNELSEVVVTGVGTATEKRRVSIDVATVSNKDFAKSATTDVTQSLVGQIAGAQIQQTSGQPGSQPLIILRGYTNLGSSQPLILIDGVQSDPNLLSSLDPNIVDHIEVVKGSAGGMLYGAKGGNGVIQVFTKKGAKNAALSIDFSSKYSSDHVLKGNDLVAKDQHYKTNAAGQILDQNGNVLAQDIHGIWQDPQELDWTVDKTVQNNKPINLPTYDHVDQSYHTASTFQNSLNIRGGSEKTDYLFSVSNLAQQDVFSNNYNRTNVTTNFGFQITKGLTFRNSAQLIYTHEDLLTGSRFNEINSYQWINFNYIDPTTGKRTVKPNDQIDGNNSNSEADYHTRYSNTPRIVENANLNYKFPKFVELDVKYSIDYRTLDGFDFYQNQASNFQPVYWGASANGSITDNHDNFRTQYGNASLFFRTDFKNDFHINIPLKTTTQVSYDFTQFNEREYYLQGTGLTPYPPYNIAGASSKTGSDFASSSLIYGFLVNQTIDWGNLFGITGGFRSDYSSIFGGQSKPFTFPRGTVYFNPSEIFSDHSTITNWKLRAAYGEAGVQPNFFGNYDRQLTFTPGQLGDNTVGLSTPTIASNPLLAVQVTKELEVGTDVTFTPFKGNWGSRISFSGSYWKRSSDNVEQNAVVAPSSGFEGTLDNLISLRGHGVDLSLDASVYKSENFGWDLGVRWATSKTEITKISNNTPVTQGVFQLKVGDQLGVFYGQTPLHSVNQVDPNTGARYIAASDVGNFTLVNGNVVDTRTYAPVITAADDISKIGNSNPDFTSSLMNKFMIYKKLFVSFQFDWNKGGNIYNQTNQWLYRDRLSADFDKPVTIAGNTGSYVAYYNGFYNTLNPISWFVEDASFVRLRDASISYNLTSTINQKWAKNVVLTVSGRNLATWTKYKGLDPEATAAVTNQGGTIGNIGSYRGVDYYATPNLRSYQLTLNVGF